MSLFLQIPIIIKFPKCYTNEIKQNIRIKHECYRSNNSAYYFAEFKRPTNYQKAG